MSYEPQDPRQRSLFVTGRARRSDPDTSQEAADSIGGFANSHRRKIVEYLTDEGEATGDHLDEVFGWKHATANRRLPELRELGIVRMTDRRAITRSGRSARLWELTSND